MPRKREDLLEMVPSRFFCSVLVSFWSLVLLAGCASTGGVKHETAVVQPGDSADISYLCRLRNGEIAASTVKVAEDQPRSALYIARSETGPLSLRAVSPDGPPPQVTERPIEDEIADRLTRIIVGMREGESRRVEFSSEDIPHINEGSYTSRLARVRKRPKEMKMTIDEYRNRTGTSPEAGQVFTIDPDFPGRVEEITDNEVVIRFPARVGSVIETPFGPGLVGEEKDYYTITIDTQKGALVRAGNLVGRVIALDDRVITVDFRNPFGGETLICDVRVERIEERKPIRSEAESHN
jgi:FKBP-type peptidyl-prolyl cis-trans isomerase 2